MVLGRFAQLAADPSDLGIVEHGDVICGEQLKDAVKTISAPLKERPVDLDDRFAGMNARVLRSFLVVPTSALQMIRS